MSYRNFIALRFKKMKHKLPPVDTPVFFQDIAGRLYFGQFHGRGKVFDFDTLKHTKELAYDVTMHSVDNGTALYGPAPARELIAWATIT